MRITDDSYLDKKMVVWGTGDRGAFFSSVTKRDIAFFVDSDKKKEGSIFDGKQIFHPESITEWKNLFVVIAVDNHAAIDDFLIAKGMKRNSDFIHYTKLSEGKGLSKHNIDEVNQFFNEIKKKGKFACAIFGAMTSFDPNCINNLNFLNSICRPNDFIIVSESMKINQQNDEGIVHFPFITLPAALMPAYYMSDIALSDISEKEYNHIESIDYLKNAKTIIMGRNPNLSDSCAAELVLLYEKFACRFMKECNPNKVMIWNQFYPFHLVMDGVCKDLNVSILYLEHGVLPGTYAIDKCGQMGESYVSVESKKFADLSISDEELKFASSVWEFLYESRINRNSQVPLDIESIRAFCDPNTPILFYAGQNDYESGLYPYTDRTLKFHSPAYLSSLDALNELACIAKKNNWNLLYKPHPLVGVDRANLPSNVVLIEQGDINELVDFADVTITILSQVGYVSVIRRKPTVMLGFNQLRGKHCTYEAYDKNDLESVIKESLDKGFTSEQKMAFNVHIAQLLKYYLFDNNSDRKLRYGRSIETVRKMIIDGTLL